MLLLAACTGPITPPPAITPSDSPGPGETPIGGPSPTPAPTPVPSPTPRPTSYRIRPGDNLIAVARHFGLSVAQIVHANPSIKDPNTIQAGAVIVIPPRTSPTGLPRFASLADPSNDLVDATGFPTAGQSYADILHFETSFDAQNLVMEILLINSPPPIDPSVETVTYTINIDTDGDNEPDYTVVYSNALPGQPGYAASLEDRKAGSEQAGAAFPGTVKVLAKTIQLTVTRAAVGDPAQFALAAGAERRFFPGGPGDSEAEDSIDLDPNQQWPHPNPRWLEIGL